MESPANPGRFIYPAAQYILEHRREFRGELFLKAVEVDESGRSWKGTVLETGTDLAASDASKEALDALLEGEANLQQCDFVWPGVEGGRPEGRVRVRFGPREHEIRVATKTSREDYEHVLSRILELSEAAP